MNREIYEAIQREAQTLLLKDTPEVLAWKVVGLTQLIQAALNVMRQIAPVLNNPNFNESIQILEEKGRLIVDGPEGI